MARSDRAISEAHALSRRLFELVERSKASFANAVAERGLTSTQARALFFLEQPAPMRDLAAHLSCDASNVTGIADRLEGHGLIERIHGDDRRVKMLRLTDQGLSTRQDLEAHLASSPSPSDRLTAAERRQLAVLLDKMLG